MSKTIDIPGGQATLRDPNELKVRQRRLIEAARADLAISMSKITPELLESAQGADREDAARLGREMLAQGVNFGTEDWRRIWAFQDATIIALLESWTLPDALPTMETIEDMDEVVYDVLADATKQEGAAMAQGEAAADFSPNPDQGRPTGPSSVSAGDLRGETVPSNGQSQNAGESIAIEGSTT